MRYLMALNAFALASLILVSAETFAQHGPPRPADQQDRAQAERGQMDVDRDRSRDRDRLQDPTQDLDRLQDRERDQDRIHAPDFSQLSDSDIFGREVMSIKERNDYRMQLQNAASAEERQQIEAQHRELVQARARSQGVGLASPGEGMYGGALMSVEERARYREQLSVARSAEERAQFMTQHRESMQQRARSQGVALEDLEETEEAE